MGADLFIRSLYDKTDDEYRPLFDKAAAERNAYQDQRASAREKAAHQTHDPYGIGAGTPDPACTLCQLQGEVNKYYALMFGQGYFRDNYNGGNFLSKFGLSWWKDILPRLNKKGELSPTKAKKLRAEIIRAELQPVTREWLESNRCAVDDGENSPEAWNNGFLERRAEFVKFLDTAIALKEPIYCSL